MNCLLRLVVFTTLSLSAQFAVAGIGFNFGVGLPYVQQYGLDYKISDKLSAEALVNALDLSIGEAGVEMNKTEVGLKYHPFGGAFFLGLAYGSFDTSATATSSGQSIKVTVDGSALTAKLGWMWGIANDGFYFGMDVGYQSPMGAEAKVEQGSALSGTTEYEDAVDAAEKYGESGSV
ncbi:MAG: hypothetical protein VX642_09715, partial [Bdellovibrionota bacterium]|nr:hypothetical protein [Bdellovibrionota bacterium]